MHNFTYLYFKWNEAEPGLYELPDVVRAVPGADYLERVASLVEAHCLDKAREAEEVVPVEVGNVNPLDLLE